LLSALLHTLDSLAAARALQLITGLVVCGATLLMASDHRLTLAAFLAQRSIIFILLWPTLGIRLDLVNVIAFFAIALVLYGTEWRLRCTRIGEQADTGWGQPFRMSLSFRALAAALGLLVAYGAVQTYIIKLLPPIVGFATAWLFVVSLLSLLLASGGLGAGLGALTFADACRILYALGQPNLLVWGLWNVCDVLLALGTSYLHSAGAVTTTDSAPGRRL
jgi:hypothetical protein